MKWRWLTAMLALPSCGPGVTEFFGDPPAGHQLIGAVVDTALVRRLETDSISAEGVRWVVFAEAQSSAAGRDQISTALSVVAVAYTPLVADSLLRGDPALDLWNRLSAQSPAQRMHIARADALTITSVSVDTVARRVVVDSSVVEERWLAIVSAGQVWLNPTAGLREVEN